MVALRNSGESREGQERAKAQTSADRRFGRRGLGRRANHRSGGPVFQRTSNDNYIKAVGSISAGSTDGHDVLYALIGAMQTVTNTHLDTNPTG